MNTLILCTLAFASLIVIIAGAVSVVVMIVYYIQVMWSKISACAKNTMEYCETSRILRFTKPTYSAGIQ